MNLNELLNSTITEKVDAKKYLYHVTFTKNVPNIKKKGLIQFQPSNWIKGPGGDRYNNDIAGIFAFDHPKDALNWAGKMEWEFRDTDKNISIVRIDMEDFWEDDPAEDPFVSNKGKAKYSPRDIKADKIIDVLDMSGIKRPGDLGISRDEWLADVSKKLEEVGRPKKIDALDYDIDSTTDIDNIANNDDISVSAEQKELVSMILANTSLKPRYKKVIFKRFWKGETLEKVADSFGVTRERIRQMELKALRMMRYQARKLGVIEFEKLTELHGGGGIPDYTTMPAYGLKRAKKGKHKFFVPKGEKLPAGVGAIKEEMAGEERYHDYTIKYILAPNAQGIYRGIIHPPKNLKDTLEAKRLEATSIDELIHSAKEWIESGFSPSRSWSEVPTDASITLDLNSSFMLDSLGVNAMHYIKLSQINGRPVLLVAPDDAIENYGSNEVEKKQGYKKTATKSPGTSSSFMSKAKAKEIGLKPNGRYTLEKSNKKTDNMGSDIYSMVFNSIVSPTKEQKRLSVPAVTIAVNRSTKRSVPLEGLTEATQKYYHGSYDKLENGTILTPGGDDYEASWGGTSFYGPLEKFRPPEKLAHKEGVFMVGDIDDVDVAGGATEYIYIVEPIGDVQKHDLNWGSEISGLMDNGKKPNDKEVKQAADNYWNGVPHHNEQVWEYLAPRAKIVSVLDEAWKVKVPTKKKRKMSKQDKDWSMLRTALESNLFEAGTGDCFEVANRAMIGMTEEQEVYGMKCIHAYVYGQGDLKGRRFPHAWNEQGDVVFDNSNGNNIVMRKEQYYALGGVVQESGAYATYDKDDCLIKMLKHSHYGPWDLNDSLDENIPDEAKEIGKEKSRIPRNLLNTIKNELDLEAQVESAWEEFKSNVE